MKDSIEQQEEEELISDDDSNGGKKDHGDDDDEEISEYEEIFTAEERKKHYPGFFLTTDLKWNQTAADFYNGTLDPTLGHKTRLINKIVHVPASYCGIDALKKKW